MPMLLPSRRFLARSPVWVARGAALLAAALTLCSPDAPLMNRAALAILSVTAVLTTVRRRWRFPAAVLLGLLALLELFQLLIHGKTDELLPALPLACVALEAAASLALLWPRARAGSPGQPLPALPGAWVVQSTLAVVVGRALLFDLRRIDGSMSAEVLAASGICTLAYFALLKLSSHLRRWRWVGCLAATAAPVVVMTRLPFSRSGALSDPREVLLLALGPGLFALGLEWIRAPLTPAARFARGLALAVVAAAPAPFIALPGQALSLRMWAMLLGNAVAFGIAAALAPRTASTRQSNGDAPLMSAPPRQVLLAIAGVAIVFCFNASGFGTAASEPSHASFWMGAVVTAGFLLLVSCFRARTARAVIWLTAGTALVWVTLVALAESERDGRSLLFLLSMADVLAFSLLSWVLASRRATAHFLRRRRRGFAGAPRLSLAFAGGAAAVGSAALALAFAPQSRGRLIDLVAGPVPLEAPLFFAPVAPSSAQAVAAASAVAVDPLGRGVWVADEENDQVELLSGGGTAQRIPVGKWPEQVVVDSQGFAYVSCREAGEVDRIAPDFSVRGFHVGREPRGLALDEARHLLYVGLVADSAVRAIDTSTGGLRGSIALASAPNSLALTPQGLAVLPRLGSEVSFLDPSLARERRVPLPADQRRAWHGQALVPVGQDLVVVYAAVDTGLTLPVPTGGYGGGVETPVELRVAVMNRGQPAVYPARIDHLRTLPGADVTGAVVDGNALYLASRGTEQVMGVRFAEMDRSALRGGIFVSNSPRVAQEQAGAGLNGLALLGSRLLTLAAFPRELVSLELSDAGPTLPPGLHVAEREPIGQAHLEPELARGRELFYRANEGNISAANLSCAVCHPDGRDDGLVWRFHGSRLRTPFLADRVSDSAPYNWHGTEPTLEGNIQQTIRRLGGKGLPDDDVKALARYLREGLRQPPGGAACDTSLVALGRNVFQRADVGCAGCHVPESGFTDGASHEVGTLSAREREEIRTTLAEAHAKPPEKDAPAPDGPRSVREAETFDTPSLRHLAASPPYFHDGAAPTLAALVADNRDRMGRTSHLTPHEREALVAYLKSL